MSFDGENVEAWENFNDLFSYKKNNMLKALVKKVDTTYNQMSNFSRERNYENNQTEMLEITYRCN